MKTLLAAIKPLIQINALVVSGVLLVMMIRGRQAETGIEKEKLIYNPQTHYREIKAENPEYLRQIAENRQIIRQNQQEIQSLQKQLNRYLLPGEGSESAKTNQEQPLSPASGQTQPMPADRSSPALIAPQGNKTSDSRRRVPDSRPLNPQSTSPLPVRTSPAPLASLRLTESKPQTEQLKNQAKATPRPKNSPAAAENNREESIRYANDLVAGLLVAHKQGEIKRGTGTHQKVQAAIVLLRRGKTLETAAERSKVPISTLKQLIAWGANRPGSSVASNNPIPNREFKTLANGKHQSISQANDIAAGLLVADTKGQINYGTKTYRQVQTAIRLLRRGGTLEAAARQANIPTSTLQQLIEWGANRPGSFNDSNSEITLAEPTETP